MVTTVPGPPAGGETRTRVGPTGADQLSGMPSEGTGFFVVGWVAGVVGWVPGVDGGGEVSGVDAGGASGVDGGGVSGEGDGSG
jgi:hypothetical protein